MLGVPFVAVQTGRGLMFLGMTSPLEAGTFCVEHAISGNDSNS